MTNFLSASINTLISIRVKVVDVSSSISHVIFLSSKPIGFISPMLDIGWLSMFILRQCYLEFSKEWWRVLP